MRDDRRIEVVQRDGVIVSLTLQEARAFAFRLLTAVAEVQGSPRMVAVLRDLQKQGSKRA